MWYLEVHPKRDLWRWGRQMKDIRIYQLVSQYVIIVRLLVKLLSNMYKHGQCTLAYPKVHPI